MGKEIKEEIIDKNIRYIEERFLKEWFIEKWENYWIKKIKEWVYAIWSKNLRNYIDKKGNLIIDIKTLIEWKFDPDFFQKAQILSWYYFERKDNKNHLYELEYNWTAVKDLPPEKLLFLVLQLKWKTDFPKNKWVKKWKEIDKFSEEYFQAWKNIAFFEIRITIKSFIEWIKYGVNKAEKWFWEKWDFLSWAVDLKALTIEDIEFFADHNMLAKDKKENERLKQKYIKQIIKYLPEMAVNENFYKLWDQLTKKKLKTYYKKWYLTKNQYESLLILFDGLKKEEEKVEEKKKTEEEKEFDKINKKLDEIFEWM
jgi:hypothetical protein